MDGDRVFAWTACAWAGKDAYQGRASHRGHGGHKGRIEIGR